MRVYATPTPTAFKSARIAFDQLVSQLGHSETLDLPHEAVETMLEQAGRELVRQLFQDHLDLRSVREARRDDVRGSDGSVRTHVRRRSRSLMTLFGSVQVNRLNYGSDGVASLSPLDRELNLPRESYSFGTRRRAAIEACRGSFDEAVDSVRATTGSTAAKRQVQQLAERAARDFEAFYRQRPVSAANSADLLVLSTDAKGIVVRTEDLRIDTRRAVEKARRKMSRRLTRGEVTCRKRMAQAAAVYDVAPHTRTAQEVVNEFGPVHEMQPRPRPYNKRVWASIDKEAEFVLNDAFREALRRDPQQRRRWVVVVDGHRGQLKALKRVIRRFGVKVQVVLDIVHVLERLWAAAVCFYSEADPRRQRWVADRLLRVLQGRTSGVAAGIRRSATRRDMSKSARKAADACARYLLQNKALMRYDDYLAHGFPIASGVIEGTCRHLIKDRFAITGARWSLAGAEAILQLRALRASGDFDNYWAFHLEQELCRNHLVNYATAS